MGCMMCAKSFKQSGLSFYGFLTVVFALIIAIIVCLKIVPAYVDNKTILNKFNETAHDPDLKHASVNDIRSSFAKRVAVSNITSVNSENIEVTQTDDGISLSANYTIKIPVVGNISLLLEFNPKSSNTN